MLTNIELLNNSEENLKWLNYNYPKIQEEFADNLIAIKNKMIVANARKIEDVLAILKRRNIVQEEVLIELIRPKNEITIL